MVFLLFVDRCDSGFKASVPEPCMQYLSLIKLRYGTDAPPRFFLPGRTGPVPANDPNPVPGNDPGPVPTNDPYPVPGQEPIGVLQKDIPRPGDSGHKLQ